MIDRSELTPALQRVVATLVDDLRVRADTVDEVSELVAAEFATAQESGRTAHDLETWREGLLAQVAVSWVLGCVFVRFCEDNELVDRPLLSGRGEWRRWASDAQTEFFREHREAGERAYLTHVYEQAAQLPGLGEVFGPHNPVWQFGPSDDACRSLIGVFREIDPESGDLVWDFADDAWDTRFLGDLYQDLSEHAKKTFALLQTPVFVEEFILDRTLDPAIEEFGLIGTDGGFRMIDPACGSGHFLLGGFDRLANRWLERDPAAGRRAAAARALESVFGVDINPFAASIARFRLLVAALRFAEVPTLAEAPVFEINVAVGDSLLHGPAPGRLQGVLEVDEQQSDASRHLYGTEDAETVGRFLGQEYHAVVANPPYITPKDPAANQAYRDRYESCRGLYNLSVPFMERLFDLARRGALDRSSGYVGQITSNAFMTAAFGRTVVQEFLAKQVMLTTVIDTSGAYVPGHGTPTVILFGRNARPHGADVRVVLGREGEPETPVDPSRGLVWSSIVDLIGRPGAENRFVTVDDRGRGQLATHPWSMQGGAAGPLKNRLEAASDLRLGECCSVVGFTGQSNIDDVFVGLPDAYRRKGVEAELLRPLVVGDEIRDWQAQLSSAAILPYQNGDLVSLDRHRGFWMFVWPFRTSMWSRRTFNKRSYREDGRSWYEWHQFAPARVSSTLSLTFAFVSTHNHYAACETPGWVFNRTGPVLVPRDEGRVWELLGYLNSSSACFWLKQVSFNKGSTVDKAGARQATAAFESFYNFDTTKIKGAPIPLASVASLAASLHGLAVEADRSSPRSAVGAASSRPEVMAESEKLRYEVLTQMVWLQEELDWRCMFAYGVTEEDLSFGPDEVFELAKGERAFEIALARRMAAGEVSSTWFARHGSTPITELPSHWPEWYRERVEQRLALIESDRFVNLLERPEYKRRWNWESWDDLADEALREWLLTRLEDGRFWSGLEPRSVAQLADVARGDAEFVQVAELYRGSSEVDLVGLIGELMKSDAVPYLAAWRYKDSGLRKRAAWERTWDLQRREDAGEDVGKIPVPPKYSSADFRSATMWKLRGKLDVPKERFVSYPGAERDSDATAVYGWAGWDHLDQAKAIVALYQHRRDQDGWDAERLTPLLAGLAELVPWLRQWHNDVDPDIGMGLGDYFADYLTAETHRNTLTPVTLQAWRPPQKTRGRKRSAQ